MVPCTFWFLCARVVFIGLLPALCRVSPLFVLSSRGFHCWDCSSAWPLVQKVIDAIRGSILTFFPHLTPDNRPLALLVDANPVQLQCLTRCPPPFASVSASDMIPAAKPGASFTRVSRPCYCSTILIFGAPPTENTVSRPQQCDGEGGPRCGLAGCSARAAGPPLGLPGARQAQAGMEIILFLEGAPPGCRGHR